MARTKATVGAKIYSGKSSKARCSVGPPISNGTSGSSDKSTRNAGGGNPVCPRETPKWQKPITNFFINKGNDSKPDSDGETAGSSKSKPKKHNVIESSDEGTPEKPKDNENTKNHTNLNDVKPKNHELDETIELEPLTGENSHKIQEYYPKGAKVKGAGKKTKGTKHVDKNESEEDNTPEANGKIQDLSENSNDSTDKVKAAKGKGIGKKTKGTKHVECNRVSEEETLEEEDSSESSNDGTISKSIGKENINSNIASVKNNNNGRKKREREDGIEEDNISKKVKVN